MGRSSLKTEASNLDALIAEQLIALRRGDIRPEHVLRLCRYQRQRACASLLLHLDVADFCRRLTKSALAYLFLLANRGNLTAPDPYFLARSKGTPILDAIAATDWPLAAEIAGKSTPAWTTDMEDEDDFCYFATLGAMIGPADTRPAADLLVRFEASSRGGSSPRAEALAAILAQSDDAFDSALADMLAAWGEQANKARASATASPYFANIESNVCVEGLALVRLAARNGLRTTESYSWLPKHALEIAPAATRPTIWEDLG